MTRSAALLAVLAPLVTLAACHRSTEAPAEVEASDPAVVASMTGDAEATLLPARCRKTATAIALGGDLEGLELGDAVDYAGGFAVALVHRTAAGRTAAIALLHRDPVALVRVLDLGPTLGDAPPPRLGAREGGLVAAAYVRAPLSRADAGHADSTRDVALYSIGADGVTGTLTVSEQRDDSLALDLALRGSSGLLVWDEATSGPRGVVKAAVFSKEQMAPAHEVSPPESDAELPRVVPSGSGFLVFWIARRPEGASGLDASGPEAVGEARSFGWLEAVAVDAHGEAVGPVRRLTSPNGHVSAYDVEAPEAVAGTGAIEGLAAPGVLVALRDDGEAVDGSGGTLLRLRVGAQGAGPGSGGAAGNANTEGAAAVVLPTDGLGRGAPAFVSGGSPSASLPPSLALAWVGRDEQARLVPLDSSGAPAGPPSAEDAWNDARPLLFAGPSAGLAATAEVLVATPSEAAAQLRVFACQRHGG
jgi:hypothetical protein